MWSHFDDVKMSRAAAFIIDITAELDKAA